MFNFNITQTKIPLKTLIKKAHLIFQNIKEIKRVVYSDSNELEIGLGSGLGITMCLGIIISLTFVHILNKYKQKIKNMKIKNELLEELVQQNINLQRVASNSSMTSSKFSENYTKNELSDQLNQFSTPIGLVLT